MILDQIAPILANIALFLLECCDQVPLGFHFFITRKDKSKSHRTNMLAKWMNHGQMSLFSDKSLDKMLGHRIFFEHFFVGFLFQLHLLMHRIEFEREVFSDMKQRMIN